MRWFLPNLTSSMLQLPAEMSLVPAVARIRAPLVVVLMHGTVAVVPPRPSPSLKGVDEKTMKQR